MQKERVKRIRIFTKIFALAEELREALNKKVDVFEIYEIIKITI